MACSDTADLLLLLSKQNLRDDRVSFDELSNTYHPKTPSSKRLESLIGGYEAQCAHQENEFRNGILFQHGVPHGGIDQSKSMLKIEPGSGGRNYCTNRC